MQDVQRAIRLVRQNDTKYGIDSNRVGVLGFSAGGHLTVMAGVQYDTKCYEPVDHVDNRSPRPSFICPIYAAYLGDNYKDDKAELGSLIKITENTPPTFMAVTWDDKFEAPNRLCCFLGFASTMFQLNCTLIQSAAMATGWKNLISRFRTGPTSLRRG